MKFQTYEKDTEERMFYDALHETAKEKFEKIRQDGEEKDQYMTIFEMLLRLRQCTDHPLLVMLGLNQDSKRSRDFGLPFRVYREIIKRLKNDDPSAKVLISQYELCWMEDYIIVDCFRIHKCVDIVIIKWMSQW